MQNPTSDAHSNTYSINANFEGISYKDTHKSILMILLDLQGL